MLRDTDRDDGPGCVGPLVPVHLSRPSFVACLHSLDSEKEQRTVWMWSLRDQRGFGFMGGLFATLSSLLSSNDALLRNLVGLKSLFRLCTRKFPLVMVLWSFWGRELLKITLGKALTAVSQRDVFGWDLIILAPYCSRLHKCSRVKCHTWLMFFAHSLSFPELWNVSAEPFKVYSWVLALASARRRTLPSLTGPSADEGHRNVRAAPAFDPSAGRVWDQEDSASLRGAQTRGGHSPSRFSRDGIITHTRVAKLLQWKLKNRSPFSFFLCYSISLTLSLPPPILFFFFLLFLLTAKWPWEFRDGFLELTRGRIKGNFGMIDPWDQSGVIVQPLCFLLQTRTAICQLICNSLRGAWVHFVVSESMINQ